jgi:hypothetical protein
MSEPGKRIARSADSKGHCQLYSNHVSGVYTGTVSNAITVSKFMSPEAARKLIHVTSLAAEYHDIDKLTDDNQDALGDKSHVGRLPDKHFGAGVYLVRECHEAALLIAAHHLCLSSPSVYDEIELQEQDLERISMILNRHREEME